MDVRTVLDRLRGIERSPENLVKALRAAQEVEGYLPAEVVKAVAEYVSAPYSRAFSAATFYDALSTERLGRYRVLVCTGITCYLKGGKEILRYLRSLLGLKEGQKTSDDGLFTIEEARCLSCCAHAPVVAVHGPGGEKRLLGRATPRAVSRLIEKLRRGRPRG